MLTLVIASFALPQNIDIHMYSHARGYSCCDPHISVFLHCFFTIGSVVVFSHLLHLATPSTLWPLGSLLNV